MRKFGALGLLVCLLVIGGCGGKKSSEEKPEAQAPIIKRPIPLREVNRSRVKTVETTPPLTQPRLFTLRDLNQRQTRLEFEGDHVRFHRIRQPLVLIVLFADWCPPCRGMLPYLSRLQAANSNELFILGIPVNSERDPEALRRFILRYDINFFVSDAPDNDALGSYLSRRYNLGDNYPLPLTLIYKNGRYVMNISGAAPYEMLQNLIDQLKEKKKKREE